MKGIQVIVLVCLIAVGCSKEPPIAVSTCFAPDAAVRIDHVVIAVGDLPAAVNEFVQHGFTSKPGRLHANGLLNAHFKFEDGTELELMTLQGEVSDEMSADYEGLISQGGGGAFLALEATQSRTQSAAAQSGIPTFEFSNLPFHFVTFQQHDLKSVFAIEYEQPFQEEQHFLTHPNGVVGTKEVWIEAGPGLVNLLEEMGARVCGRSEGPFGEVGIKLAVQNGTIVVVSPPGEDRPQVLGVRVQTTGENHQLLRPQMANGFWIEAAKDESTNVSRMK